MQTLQYHVELHRTSKQEVMSLQVNYQAKSQVTLTFTNHYWNDDNGSMLISRCSLNIFEFPSCFTLGQNEVNQVGTANINTICVYCERSLRERYFEQQYSLPTCIRGILSCML